MKKLILMTGLMIISLQAKLYAQETVGLPATTETDATFNAASRFLNVRNVIILKEGKLILELRRSDDYQLFANMDSLIGVFLKDIAFYKDSLAKDPTSSIRIDYAMNDQYSFKKIRFKKHRQDGDTYVNRDGEIGKLKLENDTVHFAITRIVPGGLKRNHSCNITYHVDATFILGNYYDLAKIVADNILGHSIDTIEQTTNNYAKKHWGDVYYQEYSSSYNPYYSGPRRFSHYNYLDGSTETGFSRYDKHKFTFNPQLGVGVVRNTLTPIGDVGIQFNRYWNNFKMQNILRLSVTGYYFFDKDLKGDFIVNDNWFVNFALGSIYDRNESNWIGKEVTIGAGYLFSPKGGYFKNSTFRLFTDLMFIRRITIVPEFIFTNDFKQIYPGITVKFF